MIVSNLIAIRNLLNGSCSKSRDEAYAKAVEERLNKSLHNYYKSLLASSDFLSRKNELRVVKNLTKENKDG